MKRMIALIIVIAIIVSVTSFLIIYKNNRNTGNIDAHNETNNSNIVAENTITETANPSNEEYNNDFEEPSNSREEAIIEEAINNTFYSYVYDENQYYVVSLTLNIDKSFSLDCGNSIVFDGEYVSNDDIINCSFKKAGSKDISGEIHFNMINDNTIEITDMSSFDSIPTEFKDSISFYNVGMIFEKEI